MSPQEILDNLNAKFPGAIVESKLDVTQPWIRVAPDRIREVCLHLRDDAASKMDYLMCLSGVDYNNGTFGVVYHLSSVAFKHKITLKVFCPKEAPKVQSVHDIWGTANWHEREAFDMIGIQFTGHPDLRRMLLPDDWVGHPLQKDYKVPEFYNGMKVPY